MKMKTSITLPNVNRWNKIIFGIIIMMCIGTVYSWSVFRLAVERHFNVGSVESGYPYMFSLAFYALFVLLTSKYIERYSPSKIISLGGILVGLGWICSGFVSNIYVLTVTYGMIIGAGAGIVYGVPMNVIAKSFPDHKGLATGLVLVGFGLSPLVTAPIANYLVLTLGVMRAFTILGAVFLMLIPLLSLTMKNSKDYTSQNNLTQTTDTDKTTKEMLKTKDFKSLYITFICGTMIGLTIIGITSNVGVQLINLSSHTIALLMPLFAVFNGLGRVIFGVITDKYSNKISMTLSYTLILIAALLMLFASPEKPIIYIITFCILWLNLGGWLAIAPTTTLKLFGVKNYSKNYGVVFTAYGIGAISGVLIAGLLKDTFGGYTTVFYFIIIISLIGLVTTRLGFNQSTQTSQLSTPVQG